MDTNLYKKHIFQLKEILYEIQWFDQKLKGNSDDEDFDELQDLATGIIWRLELILKLYDELQRTQQIAIDNYQYLKKLYEDEGESK